MNKNYTLIHHDIRKDLGITFLDYCLCSAIYHLSRYRECNASNRYFADNFGVSTRAVINSKNRLVEAGLIVRREDGFVSTNKWHEYAEIFNAKPPKEDKKSKTKKVNMEFVQSVWDYYREKTGRRFSLSPERITLINKHNKKSLDDLKTAIDNFVNDDWEHRQEYIDLRYCLGVKNGEDLFEKWLNKTPKKQGLSYI